MYGNSTSGCDGAEFNEVLGASSFPYAADNEQSTSPPTDVFIVNDSATHPFNVLTISAAAPSNPTSAVKAIPRFVSHPLRRFHRETLRILDRLGLLHLASHRNVGIEINEL